LSKCFERVRSGVVDREEAAFVATEVRRDSTGWTLPPRRAIDAFECDLDPFLDPLETVVFGRFALSRMDLADADVRADAFFVGFDLGFAFVTINAANLYGLYKLMSRRPAVHDLLFTLRL
jgi:hypothetical protein